MSTSDGCCLVQEEQHPSMHLEMFKFFDFKYVLNNVHVLFIVRH